MGELQLIMPIYEVDEEATRKAVELYLKQAREYKVTAPVDSNVQEDPERRRHIERTEKAIARLGGRQQKLIRVRYMDDDDVMDFDAAYELGFSPRHYRRIKGIAIYRLATALSLLQFKE